MAMGGGVPGVACLRVEGKLPACGDARFHQIYAEKFFATFNLQI